jgi:hypothetical protein
MALETGYVAKKSYTPVLFPVGTSAEELFKLASTIETCETDFLAARQRLSQFRGKEGGEWSKLPRDVQKAYVDKMLVQMTLLRRLQVFYRSERELKRTVPLTEQNVIGDNHCRVRAEQLKRPQSMVSARSFQLYVEKLSDADKQQAKIAFQSLQDSILSALWQFDNLLEELACLEDTFLLPVTQEQHLEFDTKRRHLIKQRVSLLFLYRTESEYVSGSRTGSSVAMTLLEEKHFREVPVAFDFVPSPKQYDPPQITFSTGNIMLPVESFDPQIKFKGMLAVCVSEILTELGLFSPQHSLRVLEELERYIPIYLVKLGLLVGKHTRTTRVRQEVSPAVIKKAEDIAQKHVHDFNADVLKVNGRGFYQLSFFKNRARQEKAVVCLLCQVIFSIAYSDV